MYQEKAWEELGMELGGVHGGVEARLVGGTPTPATAGRGEARKSFATARRCSCARKEGERWSEEGLSVRSQAPARNYRPEKTYHGEQTRAPVAKGGGDAAGEMEMASAH